MPSLQHRVSVLKLGSEKAALQEAHSAAAGVAGQAAEGCEQQYGLNYYQQTLESLAAGRTRFRQAPQHVLQELHGQLSEASKVLLSCRGALRSI